MNLITHVFAGLALGEILGIELFYSVLGSIIPDIDYLLGLEHRTILHSLVFLAVLVLLFYKRKKEITSFSVAYASHLALDVFTVQGVALFYPLNKFYSYGLVYSLDLITNLALIVIVSILLLNKEKIKEKLLCYSSTKIRKITYSVLASIILGSVVYSYASLYLCTSTTIGDLILNHSNFSESCVSVSGVVCSKITEYTSSSGNEYEIFKLCNDNYNINVWLLNTLSSVEENDSIRLSAVFTTRYLNSSGYELYKVKNVEFSK